MALSDPVEFERSSRLAAPAPAVWAHATTMAGVNAELAPVIRMTFPADRATLAVVTAPSDRVAFRSWLLAGGVVPFDRHTLGLSSVDDRGELGGRFVEDSTSWVQAAWRHERTVVRLSDQECELTDRLVVRPRVALARPVVARVVPWLFARRHRWLRNHFG